MSKEILLDNVEFSSLAFQVFTDIEGKAVCLVGGVQIAVFKDYNLNHHYETKHKYKNALRPQKLCNLSCNINKDFLQSVVHPGQKQLFNIPQNRLKAARNFLIKFIKECCSAGLYIP